MKEEINEIEVKIRAVEFVLDSYAKYEEKQTINT